LLAQGRLEFGDEGVLLLVDAMDVEWKHELPEVHRRLLRKGHECPFLEVDCDGYDEYPYGIDNDELSLIILLRTMF
jgi:hypothetical protein